MSEKLPILAIAAVVSGGGAGAAAYELLDIKSLSQASTWLPFLFAAVWGLALRYLEGLSRLVENNNLRAAKHRRLAERIREARSDIVKTVAFSAFLVAIICAPTLTYRVDQSVYQWTVIAAGIAAGLMVMTCWHFLALQNSIVDFKARLVELEKASKERAEALQELSASSPETDFPAEPPVVKDLSGKRIP